MLAAHDLRDLFRQILGFEARLLVFFETADRLAERGIRRGGLVAELLDARGREAGGKVAGLDQDHLDAESPHFDLQRLAEALDGKLARRIETLERKTHHAPDRTEAQDLATPLPPHRRQHGLREAHLAHEIRVHLQLHVRLRRELHRTADAHAGIVDQHVDASLRRKHRLHSSLHRRRIAHIRMQIVYARKLFHLPSDRSVYRMTVSVQLPCHREPEARRNACYQNYHWSEMSEIEKEEERGPLARNVPGVADGAVAFILDGAVAFDVADGLVAAVLDRAVALDVSDGSVGGVLHRAVTLQVADGLVGAVLDGTVAFDMANGAVAFVLDSAVALDVTDGPVGTVHDLLGLRLRARTQEDH